MFKKIILAVSSVLVSLSFLFVVPAFAANDCSFTTVGTTMTLNANCTTDATIPVPDGYTLDGNGYSITGVDPSGGHFLGAVVANGGTTAYVRNLTVTVSGLANVCDDGADRLRGVMFDGASGSITNNTVMNINQSSSGCQEGNAIEVRNAPFDGTHPNTQYVTVENNMITNYQKTGVVANGDVDVTVLKNTIMGVGPVNYIAQNGIQFGFGATGNAVKNDVSGNWYTPVDWSSTGVLVYGGSNVKVVNNNIHDNEIGVDDENDAFYGNQADNNKIIHNTFADNGLGYYDGGTNSKIHANVYE